MTRQPGLADATGLPLQQRTPRRTRWKRGVAVIGLALGLCGLAAAAAGVVSQLLPRHFSAVQQQQIETWETAGRWRAWPAGAIFPARIRYQLPGGEPAAAGGRPLTAVRVGIAAEARCTIATDPPAAALLDRLGCVRVLRATYLDATRSLAVTVGVAVLPSQTAASTAAADLAGRAGSQGAGLRPSAFPGTLAASFGTLQRQVMHAASDGPYLLMTAAGFADGRPGQRHGADRYADAEMDSVAAGVADGVGLPLGAQPAPPACPGAPGC